MEVTWRQEGMDMMVSISSTILGVPWALLPPPAPAPARISASANRAWAAVSTNTNIYIVTQGPDIIRYKSEPLWPNNQGEVRG